MIFVKIFTVNPVTHKVDMPGHIIAKFPDDSLEWDYTNPNLWRKFIKKNYADFIFKYGGKIRWIVYKFGGNPGVTNFFPGYDTEAKQLDLVKYAKII